MSLQHKIWNYGSHKRESSPIHRYSYKSQNHRITEWPGLKRITMTIQFQTPCQVQGVYLRGMCSLKCKDCFFFLFFSFFFFPMKISECYKKLPVNVSVSFTFLFARSVRQMHAELRPSFTVLNKGFVFTVKLEKSGAIF